MTALHTGGEAPVLDRAHLARYTDGDAALEAELFVLLKAQAERCLAALEAASAPGPWRDAAHTLKGAARGVGAFALADACERAEDAAAPLWPMAVAEMRRLARLTFDAIDAGPQPS